MNAKTKKRLIVVSGIIVLVLVLVLAFVGSGTAAKTMTVAEAAENPTVGQKVQVSGNVVSDSFSSEDGVLTFSIYDPQASDSAKLDVRYEGQASSTFGNEVTAICTGKIGEDGVLSCTELVTKCPSKYENSDDALSVSGLLEYGDDVVGKTVKICGIISQGSLVFAGQDERFVLLDEKDPSLSLSIGYDGALGDGMEEDAFVVLTGSLSDDGTFNATDVALKG